MTQDPFRSKTIISTYFNNVRVRDYHNLIDFKIKLAVSLEAAKLAGWNLIIKVKYFNF